MSARGPTNRRRHLSCVRRFNSQGPPEPLGEDVVGTALAIHEESETSTEWFLLTTLPPPDREEGARHWAEGNSSKAMGFYLAVWTVFPFDLMLGSRVAPRVLALTFILLGVLSITSGPVALCLRGLVAGEGVVTGAFACYLAFAFLLNEGSTHRSACWEAAGKGVEGLKRV